MENLELADLYKGKRVFVTGHTGFKGGWLLTMLEELGSLVYGYALAPDKDSVFNTLHFSRLKQSTYADILDTTSLNAAITEAQPDVVIHLAAQSLVLDSYKMPIETFATNTIGTGNVLKALEQLDKPCAAIMVTTDKVYANDGSPKPFTEEDPLGGHDPYSASKAAAEIITQSFRNSFFNPENYPQHKKSIATARSGNVIGGGDWSKNRIFPDIVRAINRNQQVTLRNPGAVRPWQHVLEPLVGYLTLGAYLIKHPDSSLYNGAWNFGPDPGTVKTVEDLTRQVFKAWGDPAPAYIKGKAKRHEAPYLILDSTKARKHLLWYPRLGFEQTIQLTVNWYEEFLAGTNDMTAFTKKQIHDYFNIL